MRLLKITFPMLAIAAGVAGTAWLTGTQAQSFPTRPIRVVVPFPVGGNVDT